MEWYKIVAAGAEAQVTTEFKEIWEAVGKPADMALFAGAGGAFYLPPAAMGAAGSLLFAFGGEPCDAPAAGDVTVAVGDPGAASLLG